MICITYHTILTTMIAGHVGQLAYDTFLIISLSSQSVYDTNPLRPNPNTQKPMSCLRVEGEGDSFKVVSAINNSEPNRSHLGHIILGIQSASQCMHFCHFIHVCRGVTD